MLNSFEQTIPAFEKLNFTVGDDGEVLVIVEGDFHDPEKFSGIEAFDIINYPYFYSVFKKAGEIATGPLRKAFDRMIGEDWEFSVKFQNSVTVH